LSTFSPISQLLAHFLIFSQVSAHFLIPALVFSTLDKIAKTRYLWYAAVMKLVLLKMWRQKGVGGEGSVSVSLNAKSIFLVKFGRLIDLYRVTSHSLSFKITFFLVLLFGRF